MIQEKEIPGIEIVFRTNLIVGIFLLWIFILCSDKKQYAAVGFVFTAKFIFRYNKVTTDKKK